MENRRARNEALFREVNERIEEISRELAERDKPTERISLVCECGLEDCTELLEVTVEEYENVRASPRRFLVLPGHEYTDTARVVERNSGFLVVEKLEEAGQVAIEHDPRSSPASWLVRLDLRALRTALTNKGSRLPLAGRRNCAEGCKRPDGFIPRGRWFLIGTRPEKLRQVSGRDSAQ